MKIKVALARLVREEKSVVVEVPEDFDSWPDADKSLLMHNVYEKDDGAGFSPDDEWGEDEATHTLEGSVPDDAKADFRSDAMAEIARVS